MGPARVPQPITQLRVWGVTVGGTLFCFLLAMFTQALFDHGWRFPLVEGVPMGHAPVMVLAIALILRLVMRQAQALQKAREHLEIRVQERTAELAKAQEATLSGEARLAGIINWAMDAIVTTDEQQRIVLFNPAAEKMFGHRASDVIGGSLDVCIPERFRVAHAQYHRAFSETGTNWRQVGNLTPISGLRANGEEFPIEAAISKVDVAGRKMFTAILRDITERVRAAEELRDREQELATIYENAPVAMLVVDSEHRVHKANRFAQQFAVSDGVAGVRYGDALRCLYALDDPRGCGFGPYCEDCVLRNKVLDTLATGRSYQQAEACLPFTIENKVREVTFLLSTASVHDGEQPVALVTLQDITARKRAEQQVQELNSALHQRNAELDAERARWQGVVEGIAEEVWVCDTQGKRSLMNCPSDTPMRLKEFKHVSQAELLEEVEILYPDGQPRPPEQAPLGRSLRGEVVRGEEIMRHRRTGNVYYRRFSSAPMRDATGAIWGAVAIVRDVTEQRQAEQALIRSEKLAATGRLAATMAHEINNPLETVGNAIYLAASDASLSDAARAHLAVAERELERAAHLTKQTLGFYRETESPTVFQLSDTANAVIELYRPKLTNKGIVISREFADADRVVAVEGEVRQILSNLLANAIDAVPKGGHIRVRTSHSTALPFRHTIRFTVADNGSGIEPALRKKIFEPFFTTKESLGTGLGLWVTKELTVKQQATIRLRSRLGGGTVFCLYFAAERRAGEHAPRPAA